MNSDRPRRESIYRGLKGIKKREAYIFPFLISCLMDFLLKFRELSLMSK
jgi:hypothetical protein